MNSNSGGNILGAKSDKRFHGQVTENTIVEGGLVLVGSSTGTSGRVRPVNFVGLSNFHTLTVLPLVGLGELIITGIIVVAPESITYASSGKCSCTVSPVGTSDVSMGPVTILIEFSVGVVLSSQMPMHIDGTHGRAEVAVGVWLEFSNIHVTYESLSYVSSSLGGNFEINTKLVIEGYHSLAPAHMFASSFV